MNKIAILVLLLISPISNALVHSVTERIQNSDIERVFEIKYYSNNNILTTVVTLPLVEAPKNGYPIFVYGHGTVGLQERCNPSKRTMSYPTMGYNKKYITILSDYDINPHNYTESDYAAKSVFDAIRAVTSFSNVIHMDTDNIIISGYSQGGSAMLKVLELNNEYAPEINIKSAILLSPGSDTLAHLKTIYKHSILTNNVNYKYLIPTAFFSVARYENNLDMFDSIFKDSFNYRHIELICSNELYNKQEVFEFTDEFNYRALNNDWEGTIWKEWFDNRISGNFYSDTPIIVVSGEFDPITGLFETKQLVNRLNDNGNDVTHYVLKNMEHNVMSKDIEKKLFQYLNTTFEI